MSGNGGPAGRAPEAERAPFYLLLGLFAATAMWWLLALARLPADTPEWVLRARAVCFGSTPSGLPDPSGWVLLIGTPLSFLAVLLTVWGRGLWADLSRRWSRPAGRALLIGLAVLPLVGGLWSAARIADALARTEAWRADAPAGPFPESYPRLNRPAPDFDLIDQHGRQVTLAALRGQVVLLTFAFAHCQTICPMTVQNVRQGSAGLAEPHRVVVITLDPWRDTAGALPAIARQWGLDEGTGLVLSGEVPAVNAVLDGYGVVRRRDPNTGDITHPPLVYVIDPEGRIAFALNGPSADWVAGAGRRAAEPSAGGATQGRMSAARRPGRAAGAAPRTSIPPASPAR